MASASHVHQTASASAILARIAVPPPPVPLTTRIPAAPPPPLHQCLCCPPPPPPPPIPINHHHFASVRNAMGSGYVELRGLSVRAHWYVDHAWICVDVQEVMVLASGNIYELPNAHISLATVSFTPVPNSRVLHSQEVVRGVCVQKIQQVKTSLAAKASMQGSLGWNGRPDAPCCFDLRYDELGLFMHTAAHAFSGFILLKPPLTLPCQPGRTLHLSVYDQVYTRARPRPCKKCK